MTGLISSTGVPSNRIQAFDEQAAPLPPQDADDRQAEAVRAQAAALGKDADLRPCWFSRGWRAP